MPSENKKKWCVMNDDGYCTLEHLTKQEAEHAAKILSEEHPDENWDAVPEDSKQ